MSHCGAGRERVRDLPLVAALGAVYTVFGFVGVGSEAFLWALVLAAAGIPVYGLMRIGSVRVAAETSKSSRPGAQSP